METQDDSIDLAKLQRDALGLPQEHDPSHPYLSDATKTTNEPNHTLCYTYHQVKAASNGDGVCTGKHLPPIIPSNPASLVHQHQLSLSRPRQHEKRAMMSNKSGNEQGIAPGSQFGNMSSAEGAPGDTQVVSQSIYDSIIRQNGESMQEDYSQAGADGATLRTLYEGDSGHIDLLSELDAAHHRTDLSQDDDDNDDESAIDQNESSPMAYAPDLFPESQRFLAETPGTAKKNETKGETTETPSISRNPLASGIESSGGLLGLSQVFGATQAPSSPIVHGLQTELVSDRPSPNIPIQPARVVNGISSPLMGLPIQFVRESSEPNLNYISMKESQTKRDRALGERLTRSADNIQSDQSDREFYKESSFVERARRQREIDEEAAVQFAGLSAPARSTSNLSARPQTSREQLGELQEDQEMIEAVASEEETEQEEDMQVPRSQELPQSSAEEDKENYDGPSLDAAAAAAAASAHDRLSQVLGFEPIPSPSCIAVDEEQEDEIAHRGSFGSYNGSQPNGVLHSSQMMVKDSQPSPQPSSKRIEADNTGNIIHRSPSRSHVVSPARDRLRSSSPCSRPQSRHSNDNTRTNGSVSNEHATQHVQSAPPNGNIPTHSSNPSEQQHVNSSHSKVDTGTAGNSSSMPSRVAETPMNQRLKHIGDMARLTSIPETSPNHSQCDSEAGSNGDGLNNEDDDLPPMFNEVPSIRKNHIRPAGAKALSSPLKKLLSSPGGGQRRALTEIAADLSPQVGAAGFDLGIGVFTTEDQEFRALIDGSPTRPKKKRRGNDGSSYIASDPIIPLTPRAQPPKSVAPIRTIQERPAPIPAESDDVPLVQVPEKAVRRQSKPPRRAPENVWEIEGSPEQPFRGRPRIGKMAKSPSTQEKHVPETSSRLAAKSAPPPKVVVHNRPPPPSSEPTEVSSTIASDDIIESEAYSVDNSPTTPRPSHTSSENTLVAPSQVLSVWMGQKRAYYPGTCFGTPLGVSQTKYSVKFEDSLPVEVPKGAVKRFELRVGDGVKIDMHNVPKVTHVVRGFGDKLTREELAKAAADGLYPMTDIYGHTTVIVGPKQRKSLPNGGIGNSENVIKVPIARVYLDTILWNQLKDRAFTYRPAPVQQESMVHTPSERSFAPASPSSRLSRSIQQGSGIFSGMVFAVSYKEDEASKNRVTRLIIENGGTVLHDGFTELFEASSIVPADTPIKGGAKDIDLNDKGLRLTALANDVGFACLIADAHSRREKYMQALALNLPCLAGRWVEDCIAQGRILDWDIYLLPAGDSMYLNGATKSRIMAPNPPSTARLAETISARTKLLAGQSVLLVMGRGKAEEKRKAYIFLTYALGASRVERVPDLGTARALIESQSDFGLSTNWDWIYVDDADQAAAKSMLTPKPKKQRIHLFHGKKRRKSIASSTPTPPNELQCTARVVSNEFVCQSLILGRLFEE
ncbi:Rad9-like Rad53-binding [Penicillium cf. griseofulvum]|uniref:Rad9-like Rad53-binding n=1 Tax=Penicillium cf. griseofulvum TaxID=2972120 RepID=A0A9W9JNR0_9EURO|nr:Rad9-like Rad53-binding [Penicillium cf. griseofulvum]KAJ5450974.1 Rad9-like Rad53-binding [Penicillium cf. griseofulvum]